MFKFIKQIFISTMLFFNGILNASPLECISLKNQECEVRPKIIDVSSNVVVIVIILMTLMQKFAFLI